MHFDESLLVIIGVLLLLMTMITVWPCGNPNATERPVDTNVEEVIVINEWCGDRRYGEEPVKDGQEKLHTVKPNAGKLMTEAITSPERPDWPRRNTIDPVKDWLLKACTLKKYSNDGSIIEVTTMTS